MRREFHHTGDTGVSAAIAARTGVGDVYIGVAVRARRDGTRGGIDAVQLIWADCDDQAAVARLVDFDPPPTLVVWSGSGGCHAYWSL